MFVEAEIMYYLRSSNYYLGKGDKNSQKDDFYLPRVRPLKTKIRNYCVKGDFICRTPLQKISGNKNFKNNLKPTNDVKKINQRDTHRA